MAASTSLTGIFAPGSPTLVESLRTLTLEPNRALAPGESLWVQFSFSNLGGAAATGVRVRFAHPQGVTHVADGDLVDGRGCNDGERFIDTAGANVGDLEPNAQRTVRCGFRVNDTIEDSTVLAFQAALVTDQTPLVASNIERVEVRSRPHLQNSATLVTIAAPDVVKPGATLCVRATVANSGSSSARDVVVILPAPVGTTYVPRSARIDGRVVVGIEGEVFDYDTSTIASHRLAAGAAVSLEYQVVIDSPLSDGTRIKAVGHVSSREHAEFAISSAEIVVSSPVDFGSDDTSFTLLCDDAVTPGLRVPMLLRAVNAGTGDASDVCVDFSLPPALVYAPGSAHVDGQPVADDAIAGLHFYVGALPAGRIVEVGMAATVAVPSSEDASLPIAASLRWRGGERNFTRRLSVRVAPRFNRARNYIETQRGTAQAREDVEFIVHVFNDGTAPETNVGLRLIPGVHLDDIRIGEGADAPMPYHEQVALGMVYPHFERTFVVVARIASKVPDRSNVSLGVVLEHGGASIDLGSATVVVRSRPQVGPDDVAWELASADALRPHKMLDLALRFTNGGSDVLRDARLLLTLPSQLQVERAIDARRDSDGLLFGDVAPEGTHTARLTLRLLHPVAENRALVIEGWLHGKGISPVPFPPLEVPTFAQPQFDADAQLVSAPTETVHAGERLYYELRLRNSGDGAADRLLVRVVPTNLAVYVPASTMINGMPIPDDSGVSQLWSHRGLALADVNPGVALQVRWEMMVMVPLASGVPLDTRAVLEWSDGHTLALSAPPLRALTQPSLAESSAGTAISIARIFPSDVPHDIAALPEPENLVAMPMLETEESSEETPPRALTELIERAALPTVDDAARAPVLYLDFTVEHLSHTVTILERSNVGGLVQHLFALRMLFPEHLVGASQPLAASLENASRVVRAPMERLFVRLRMPHLTISGKDLEDRESRFALRTLVDDLAAAPAQERLRAPDPEIVRVEGEINLDLLRSLEPDLESAPLGAVAPWLVNAHLLGDSIYRDGWCSTELREYRADVLNALTLLSELPIEEFHRVLTTSVNRSLDAGLAAVLNALRGATRVGD